MIRLSVEESIRQIYSRIERETNGAAPNEVHVLAADHKLVIIAKGSPAASRQPLQRELLQSEFAAELGCDTVTLRTEVSLANDEKMEIFALHRR